MNDRAVLWITVEVGASLISDACGQAVELAKKLYINVQFEFNGTELTATPDSNPAEIIAEYTRGRS